MTKLRDYFDEMVVYKDLRNNSFFSSLGLPAFLRDYLLKTFSDEYGNFDMQQVSAFVKKYIPKKEDWMSIKNRIVYENQQVQLLTRISIDINIKTGEISFAIPDFGVSEKETMIEPSIWETYKDELVKNGETWGIIKLGYRPPDDTVKPRLSGKIKLVGFRTSAHIPLTLIIIRKCGPILRLTNGLMFFLEPSIIMQMDMSPICKNCQC